MKPNMGMTKDDVMNESFCERKEKSTFGPGWKIAIVSTAIVLGLTIVTAAVLITIYHNKASSNADIKEYIATIYDKDSQTKETIQVSNREEKFTTRTGGTAIFDFETGFVTFSLDEHRESCYLASFNMSDIQSPGEFKAEHTEAEVHLMVKEYLTKQFATTDIWVSKKALGPMGEKECSGRDVYILRESTGSKALLEGERARRDTEIKIKVTVRIGWVTVSVTVTITIP